MCQLAEHRAKLEGGTQQSWESSVTWNVSCVSCVSFVVWECSALVGLLLKVLHLKQQTAKHFQVFLHHLTFVVVTVAAVVVAVAAAFVSVAVEMNPAGAK